VSDPSGDTPDLLAQATTSAPMAHAPRSNRHRRRRRRRTNRTLIGAIVVLVILVVAGGVIYATHKSSSSKSDTTSSTQPAVSWPYHDLRGRTVVVVPTRSIPFVSGDNGQSVPKMVATIDQLDSKGDCKGLQVQAYLANLGATTAQAAQTRSDASAIAAYARDRAKHHSCAWATHASS
jgi:hypothetical protein